MVNQMPLVSKLSRISIKPTTDVCWLYGVEFWVVQATKKAKLISASKAPFVLELQYVMDDANASFHYLEQKNWRGVLRWMLLLKLDR